MRRELLRRVFGTKTRAAASGTESLANHPVHNLTWFGAVAFCNFLSEREGKPVAYDLSTWELIDADTGAPGLQYVAGYRLPTEAEWERAAAWDGTKHWIYSFTSDTLTGKNPANYRDNNPDYVNPMGLTLLPFTSPVGWFNGVNVSPNGSVTTVNSISPAGAYDMSGNVYEWCHDWYLATTTAPARRTIRRVPRRERTACSAAAPGTSPCSSAGRPSAPSLFRRTALKASGSASSQSHNPGRVA